MTVYHGDAGDVDDLLKRLRVAAEFLRIRTIHTPGSALALDYQGATLAVNDAADCIEAKDAEGERLRKAIQSYAAHQPLDIKTPGQIQRDLHAIAGDEHIPVASLDGDICFICKRDLRHAIHIREESNR